ncbi:Phosphomannomutase/phosphoglucomutase [Maioricimonas rarisocia]|uniref:Phosphomannomutase/phosphoglucomutase n=1 Tax=Maioricimonas rarisocia TaxID=2528026 RepID=A0A517Z3M0_9PLAN|nr:hypothetical protein [Maioricimonas rarisocia]QDU37094.1 Phosphomannomutase/phosphoglucomutase [Maioricimonas rarisocia]
MSDTPLEILSPPPPGGTAGTEYRCPGESYPISRAVHLSRLAAYYPKCRRCPHRDDIGQLPVPACEDQTEQPTRIRRDSICQQEGLRGIYLNAMTRRDCERAAEAVASIAWEQCPRRVRSPQAEPQQGSRFAPGVVVGHDRRPSSPDLVTGVAAALRRMGCDVIDVGQVRRPCFDFAVDHLQAAAGMYVTGNGFGPTWNGVDIVGSGAVPRSAPGTLEDVCRRMEGAIHRPTRRGGTHRTFHATVPYQAGLWKYFHSLRPLSIAIRSRDPLARTTLEKLLAETPCDPQFISEDRNWPVAAGKDASTGFDLSLLIDEDGRRVELYNASGQRLPQTELAARLLHRLRPSARATTVVVSDDANPALVATLQQPDCTVIRGGTTMESMHAAMLEHTPAFGTDGRGRFSFCDPYPKCDAIITAAKLLEIFAADSCGESPLFI